MEEIWKALSDLGQIRYSRDRGEPDPTPAFAYEIAFTPSQWEEFHRRLLPLLNAGQASYHALKSYQYGNAATELAAEMCQAWDSAKSATLEPHA